MHMTKEKHRLLSTSSLDFDKGVCVIQIKWTNALC